MRVIGEAVLATDVVIFMIMMRDENLFSLSLNEGFDHLLIHVIYCYWELGSLFLIVNCICICIFTIKSEEKQQKKKTNLVFTTLIPVQKWYK